ncbi:uncharacterized protein BP5553_04665 [Venustampulla echinocandica]|uniref:Sfi1 spindle body domain-containing protein n=1 Tax=Venustampulla echinocandica TaxID=2656787 RepID=A0A370TNY1_9HELO|nr:uncharacterized protein BP5553_04665 [Venustampulla echinocandica]RDL37232.1 hypothetical protein BP5553_04665 [Venustampulla echinocandica]
MPPPGTDPPSNEGQFTAGSEEQYYSNEDVAILHDIVVLAQELLPTLPERERLPTNALFNAYYDILPRLGIDADHDSRYARVLFKIGGFRGDRMLYDKFEEVMSRLGIEIEFGHVDEEEQESSQLEISHKNGGITTRGTTPLQDDATHSRGRYRRNSESSLWDLGFEAAAKYRGKRSSSALDKNIDQRPGFLDEIQQLQSSSSSPRPRPGPGPDHVDETEQEEEQSDHFSTGLNLHLERPQTRRGRSVSTHDSMRIRRRSHSPAQERQSRGIQTSIDPRDEVAELALSIEGDTEHSIMSLQEFQSSRAPDGLMHIRASLVLEHHIAYMAKRQIRQWREKAIRRREYHSDLDRIATNHDRNVLLGASLATWQVQSLERRLNKDTERFYAHLERRATKARDLFLMLKCLQQWSDYSQEEVERTTAARRHIIKHRYFNAWAEITAVNELKVRRQVVKKFFGVWKKRHAEIACDNDTAVQRYQSNVAEKIYWQWFHKLWDQRAKAWWAEGAKRRALFRWIVKYHDTWENHRYAEEERRDQIVWNTWQSWRRTTSERARQDEQAVAHHRAKSCRNAIRRWRKETQVIPAKAMVQSDVNLRIVRERFEIWLHRTRQERLAYATDREKVLREAVTTWRHKVRLQVFRPKTNSRIAGQAIYKWLMTERSIWFKQKQDAKRLGSALQHWVQRAQILQQNRWQQEDIAEACAVQKMQYSVMGQWYRQMQTRQERERDANAFYAPKLLQRVFSEWSERTQHYQQLQTWSHHAKFYFQTSKMIKRWKASTGASKREKRRAAYAQVGRMVKMNLARGIYRNWRQKAHHLLELEDEAHAVRHNKTVVLGMNIFDQWRGRAEELAELESLSHEYLLTKKFAIWKGRSTLYRALEAEAMLTYQENRQARALRKWNLAMPQLRAQMNCANEIWEMNAKKSFRKMFTYWYQQAAVKRPSKTPELDKIDLQLGTTARAEAWSDFEDEAAENDDWAKGLEDASASTNIPGYLTTPSKRRGRVTGVATRLSTTPRAPLSTPFERQLRAEYSGGQLHSYRRGRGLGRSTLGMGGFEDIKERSPNG